MYLIRTAGLIALPLVATTLQASAHSLPESKDPTKITHRTEKRQQILVLSPNTNTWQENAPGPSLDDSIPPVADEPLSYNRGPVLDPSELGQSSQTDHRHLRFDSAHNWLISRYPHAPPA